MFSKTGSMLWNKLSFSVQNVHAMSTPKHLKTDAPEMYRDAGTIKTGMKRSNGEGRRRGRRR